MKSQDARQGIIWGGLLILFGIALFLEQVNVITAWGWVSLLAIGGLAVFVVYLTDRSQWGLLIPAYVLVAVAGLVAIATLDVLPGEMIAGYVLGTIALPFLVVFFWDRQQWWALIPAYVLLAVGAMVVLIGENVLDDLWIPAYVMFAIAIPFFVAYFRDMQQWWALIPGGIMAVIGFSFVIAEASIQYVSAAVLILAGVAILVRQVLLKPTPPAAQALDSDGAPIAEEPSLLTE